ncbi:NUDIX domain-containing protein [Candidatus Dojkabacteria bacterium]|nr:NUDIX domain-containing protein [Candidatus Dojkabacteria bacterium]
MKKIDFISTTNTLITKDDQILFVQRDKNLKDFPGWLMLPGGKQEVNETPSKTAIRETKEETGLKIRDPKLKIIATHNHEYQSKVYIVFIFSSTNFSGRLIKQEKAFGKPVWLGYNEALNSKNIYPDLKNHIKIMQSLKKHELVYTYNKFNEKLEIVESH